MPIFSIKKDDLKKVRQVVFRNEKKIQNLTEKNPKTIIANFIIAPHPNIDIQSAHISNISNVEIEMTLRLDNKIRDLSIGVLT